METSANDMKEWNAHEGPSGSMSSEGTGLSNKAVSSVASNITQVGSEMEIDTKPVIRSLYLQICETFELAYKAHYFCRNGGNTKPATQLFHDECPNNNPNASQSTISSISSANNGVADDICHLSNYFKSFSQYFSYPHTFLPASDQSSHEYANLLSRLQSLTNSKRNLSVWVEVLIETQIHRPSDSLLIQSTSLLFALLNQYVFPSASHFIYTCPHCSNSSRADNHENLQNEPMYAEGRNVSDLFHINLPQLKFLREEYDDVLRIVTYVVAICLHATISSDLLNHPQSIPIKSGNRTDSDTPLSKSTERAVDSLFSILFFNVKIPLARRWPILVTFIDVLFGRRSIEGRFGLLDLDNSEGIHTSDFVNSKERLFDYPHVNVIQFFIRLTFNVVRDYSRLLKDCKTSMLADNVNPSTQNLNVILLSQHPYDKNISQTDIRLPFLSWLSMIQHWFTLNQLVEVAQTMYNDLTDNYNLTNETRPFAVADVGVQEIASLPTRLNVSAAHSSCVIFMYLISLFGILQKKFKTACQLDARSFASHLPSRSLSEPIKPAALLPQPLSFSQSTAAARFPSVSTLSHNRSDEPSSLALVDNPISSSSMFIPMINDRTAPQHGAVKNDAKAENSGHSHGWEVAGDDEGDHVDDSEEYEQILENDQLLMEDHEETEDMEDQDADEALDDNPALIIDNQTLSFTSYFLDPSSHSAAAATKPHSHEQTLVPDGSTLNSSPISFPPSPPAVSPLIRPQLPSTFYSSSETSSSYLHSSHCVLLMKSYSKLLLYYCKSILNSHIESSFLLSLLPQSSSLSSLLFSSSSILSSLSCHLTSIQATSEEEIYLDTSDSTLNECSAAQRFLLVVLLTLCSCLVRTNQSTLFQPSSATAISFTSSTEPTAQHPNIWPTYSLLHQLYSHFSQRPSTFASTVFAGQFMSWIHICSEITSKCKPHVELLRFCKKLVLILMDCCYSDITTDESGSSEKFNFAKMGYYIATDSYIYWKEIAEIKKCLASHCGNLSNLLGTDIHLLYSTPFNYTTRLHLYMSLHHIEQYASRRPSNFITFLFPNLPRTFAQSQSHATENTTTLNSNPAESCPFIILLMEIAVHLGRNEESWNPNAENALPTLCIRLLMIIFNDPFTTRNKLNSTSSGFPTPADASPLEVTSLQQACIYLFESSSILSSFVQQYLFHPTSPILRSHASAILFNMWKSCAAFVDHPHTLLNLLYDILPRLPQFAVVCDRFIALVSTLISLPSAHLLTARAPEYHDLKIKTVAFLLSLIEQPNKIMLTHPLHEFYERFGPLISAHYKTESDHSFAANSYGESLVTSACYLHTSPCSLCTTTKTSTPLLSTSASTSVHSGHFGIVNSTSSSNSGTSAAITNSPDNQITKLSYIKLSEYALANKYGVNYRIVQLNANYRIYSLGLRITIPYHHFYDASILSSSAAHDGSVTLSDSSVFPNSFPSHPHRLQSVEVYFNEQPATNFQSLGLPLAVLHSAATIPSVISNDSTEGILKDNWTLARSIQVPKNTREIKIHLTLPANASFLLLHYTSVTSQSAASIHASNSSPPSHSLVEQLRCPRCNQIVTHAKGICSRCSENAYQCRICRHINYDALDAFLCIECGHCRYATFSWSIAALPSSSTSTYDAIINEEGFKKAMNERTKLQLKLESCMSKMQNLANSILDRMNNTSIIETDDGSSSFQSFPLDKQLPYKRFIDETGRHFSSSSYISSAEPVTSASTSIKQDSSTNALNSNPLWQHYEVFGKQLHIELCHLTRRINTIYQAVANYLHGTPVVNENVRSNAKPITTFNQCYLCNRVLVDSIIMLLNELGNDILCRSISHLAKENSDADALPKLLTTVDHRMKLVRRDELASFSSNSRNFSSASIWLISSLLIFSPFQSFNSYISDLFLPNLVLLLKPDPTFQPSKVFILQSYTTILQISLFRTLSALNEATEHISVDIPPINIDQVVEQYCRIVMLILRCLMISLNVSQQSSSSPVATQPIISDQKLSSMLCLACLTMFKRLFQHQHVIVQRFSKISNSLTPLSSLWSLPSSMLLLNSTFTASTSTTTYNSKQPSPNCSPIHTFLTSPTITSLNPPSSLDASGSFSTVPSSPEDHFAESIFKRRYNSYLPFLTMALSLPFNSQGHHTFFRLLSPSMATVASKPDSSVQGYSSVDPAVNILVAKYSYRWLQKWLLRKLRHDSPTNNEAIHLASPSRALGYPRDWFLKRLLLSHSSSVRLSTIELLFTLFGTYAPISLANPNRSSAANTSSSFISQAFPTIFNFNFPPPPKSLPLYRELLIILNSLTPNEYEYANQLISLIIAILQTSSPVTDNLEQSNRPNPPLEFIFMAYMRGTVASILSILEADLNGLERSQDSSHNPLTMFQLFSANVGTTSFMCCTLLAHLLSNEGIRERYAHDMMWMTRILHISFRIQSLTFARSSILIEASEILQGLIASLFKSNITLDIKIAMMQAYSSCLRAAYSSNSNFSDDPRLFLNILQSMLSILAPSAEVPEHSYRIILRKAPSQIEYIRGNMKRVPYRLEEFTTSAEIQPTVRHVKELICTELQLPNEENMIELLVGGKLVGMNLLVKDVFEKIWIPLLTNDSSKKLSASSSNSSIQPIQRHHIHHQSLYSTQLTDINMSGTGTDQNNCILVDSALFGSSELLRAHLLHDRRQFTVRHCLSHSLGLNSMADSDNDDDDVEENDEDEDEDEDDNGDSESHSSIHGAAPSIEVFPPMIMTYRLTGLDGEATEPLVEVLSSGKKDTVDLAVEFDCCSALTANLPFQITNSNGSQSDVHTSGVELLLVLLNNVRSLGKEIDIRLVSNLIQILTSAINVPAVRSSLAKCSSYFPILSTTTKIIGTDTPASILILVDSLLLILKTFLGNNGHSVPTVSINLPLLLSMSISHVALLQTILNEFWASASFQSILCFSPTTSQYITERLSILLRISFDKLLVDSFKSSANASSPQSSSIVETSVNLVDGLFTLIPMLTFGNNEILSSLSQLLEKDCQFIFDTAKSLVQNPTGEDVQSALNDEQMRMITCWSRCLEALPRNDGPIGRNSDTIAKLSSLGAGGEIVPVEILGPNANNKSMSPANSDTPTSHARDLGWHIREYFYKSGFINKLVGLIEALRNKTVGTNSMDHPGDEITTAKLIQLGNLPVIPVCFRMLHGLIYRHADAQFACRSLILLLQQLESISTKSHIGSLAESVLQSIIIENQETQSILDNLRKETKEVKRKAAMAQRKRLLETIYKNNNSIGNPIAKKAKIAGEFDDILHCVVCKEGYDYQPESVLGVYVYVKPLTLDAHKPPQTNRGASSHHRGTSQRSRHTSRSSNAPNASISSLTHDLTSGVSTVSHFHLIHLQCHADAVLADRQLKPPKSEWEGAQIRNSHTLCNALLPICCPPPSSSSSELSSSSSNGEVASADKCIGMYGNYIDTYWKALDTFLGFRTKSPKKPSSSLEKKSVTTMLSNSARHAMVVLEDIVHLLQCFSEQKSFSADSNGGGRESNIALLPILLQFAIHSYLQAMSTPETQEFKPESSKDLGSSNWMFLWTKQQHSILVRIARVEQLLFHPPSSSSPSQRATGRSSRQRRSASQYRVLERTLSDDLMMHESSLAAPSVEWPHDSAVVETMDDSYNLGALDSTLEEERSFLDSMKHDLYLRLVSSVWMNDEAQWNEIRWPILKVLLIFAVHEYYNREQSSHSSSLFDALLPEADSHSGGSRKRRKLTAPIALPAEIQDHVWAEELHVIQPVLVFVYFVHSTHTCMNSSNPGDNPSTFSNDPNPSGGMNSTSTSSVVPTPPQGESNLFLDELALSSRNKFSSPSIQDVGKFSKQLGESRFKYLQKNLSKVVHHFQHSILAKYDEMVKMSSQWSADQWFDACGVKDDALTELKLNYSQAYLDSRHIVHSIFQNVSRVRQNTRHSISNNDKSNSVTPSTSMNVNYLNVV